jgi:hypothetical protein
MATFDAILIQDLKERLEQSKQRIKNLEDALWLINRFASKKIISDPARALKAVKELSREMMETEKDG